MGWVICGIAFVLYLIWIAWEIKHPGQQKE